MNYNHVTEGNTVRVNCIIFDIMFYKFHIQYMCDYIILPFATCQLVSVTNRCIFLSVQVIDLVIFYNYGWVKLGFYAIVGSR